jgi:hypothetical protein
MKNLIQSYFVNNNTNIDYILTFEECNSSRLLIKSNYKYLTPDDIDTIINNIIDLIAPLTDLEYRERFWWKINIYKITKNDNTNLNNLIVSELINYSINIESMLTDSLSTSIHNDLKIRRETFFLIELINLKNIELSPSLRQP